MAAPVLNPIVSNVRQLLKITYGLLPLIAGADKYIHLLTDWHKYLYSAVPEILSMGHHTFMHIVGVVEILAGILVFVKTRIGAYVVAVWLLAISINLLLSGYYDIAVRDVVMSIGAFALARLTEVKTHTVS